jgi:hypothetical protein
MHVKFRMESMKEKDHSEELGIDGRKWILTNVDWIHLVQSRDRWRALVNTVMNFRVP